MTKGQRAMAVVQALEGKKYSDYTHGISKQYISWARNTLEHAPALARQVLQGSEKLTASYKKAKLIGVDAETHDTQLAELREQYPELAEKVVEDDLTRPDLDKGTRPAAATKTKEYYDCNSCATYRHPAARASAPLQNHRSPSDGEILVRSYHRLPGPW